MAIQTLLPGSGTDLTFGATIAAGDSIRAIYGNQTVTTTDLSGIAQLVDVMFGPQTGLTIGGGGTNFKVGATGTITFAGQQGSCPIEAANIAGGGTANTIARMKSIGQMAIQPSGGTFTQIDGRSGRIDSNTSPVIPTLAMCGGTSNTQFITGASGFQLAVFSGGVHTTERGLDTDFTSPRMIICGGAQVTVARATLAAATITTPATTNMPTGKGSSTTGLIGVYGPSYLNWQGWNIDALEVFGGASFDISAVPVSMTIATLKTDWKSLANGKWRAKNPGVTVTYSSIMVYGGNDDTLPN